MTYKGEQYRLQHMITRDSQYVPNQQLVLFQARRHNTEYACYGYFNLIFKTTKAIQEVPSNDKEHSERLEEVSTKGANDSPIEYSKSQKNTTVLHYCGYEYLQKTAATDGRVRWGCRYQQQKKCKGFLITLNGQINGAVTEHSHPPIDLDKIKSDRKISRLFQQEMAQLTKSFEKLLL